MYINPTGYRKTMPFQRAARAPTGPTAARPSPCPSSRLRAGFIGMFLIWRLHQKPQYGYSLMEEVQGLATRRPPTSTLYAILNKLERAGYVKSKTEKSGRRIRRRYATTPKGWALFRKIQKEKIKGLVREFLETLVG